MEKFKTLPDAIALAEFAHRNQVDKAGLPYIDHPRRVLAKVQAQGALPYVQMAAILHDVTEDTAFTPQMLLDLGIPESAVKIVRLLDRHISEREFYEINWTLAQQQGGVVHVKPSKEELDRFYYEEIRKNPGALMVKLADIEDNLSPWRLAYLEEASQKRLQQKYYRALEILNPKPQNYGLIVPGYEFNPYRPGG